MQIVDIDENYEKACIDRKKDFAVMRRSKRKCMTMYLGGIYIECLLKSVIIRKKKIEKAVSIVENRKRKIYWFSHNNYLKLRSMPNPTWNDIRRINDGFNPEHNLVQALKQIDELNRTLPADGVKRLEMLNRPINNRSFTVMRYMYDDEIPDTLYNEWESNFLYFISFFNKMKKTFPF